MIHVHMVAGYYEGDVWKARRNRQPLPHFRRVPRDIVAVYRDGKWYGEDLSAFYKNVKDGTIVRRVNGKYVVEEPKNE